MLVIACRPEEHARLTVLKAAVLGRPAAREAIRPAFEPPSSERTVPIVTSVIRLGSRLGFAAKVALRTYQKHEVLVKAGSFEKDV